MKNGKYTIKGDYEYTVAKATKKELDEARKKASKLLEKTKGQAMGFRSCWRCNPAHTHFLHGEWGDWVLMCFAECGAYYYNKIDITEYDDTK